MAPHVARSDGDDGSTSTSTPTSTSTSTAPAPAPPTPTPTPTPTPPSPSTSTPPPPPPSPQFSRLALQTEGAIGVPGPFYNQLVGGRLDRCFTWNTCLGGYVGYADLKGQAGRASEVLVYALLEHRRPLGTGWFVPLRAATGYLPKNGPFAQLSAGLGVQSGNVDFTFELLAPTLWVSGNEPVLSMDLAVEVALHL